MCMNTQVLRSWCKGTAGLALGEIALMRTKSHLQMRESARTMLKLTGDSTLSETDDLCCGNCGRIDVLIHAANKLQEPAYLESAAELASRVIERAKHKGRYSFRHEQKEGIDPRLFPGIAGIGYSFMRILAANSIPCIVTMD